jgi:hypothetical protein
MPGEVLTEVSAQLADDRADEAVRRFRALLTGPRPDGLLRTELLRGPQGWWRIQTLWRDRAALDAMRAGTEAPAAPALFRALGADPTLQVYDLAAGDATAH